MGKKCSIVFWLHMAPPDRSHLKILIVRTWQPLGYHLFYKYLLNMDMVFFLMKLTFW